MADPSDRELVQHAQMLMLRKCESELRKAEYEEEEAKLKLEATRTALADVRELKRKKVTR